MGVVACPIGGPRNAYLRQQLHRSGPGVLARHVLVEPQRLRDLLRDAVDRVERSHGILKDHSDTVAAHLTLLPVAHLKDALTLVTDIAAHHLPRRLRDKPHDRQRGHRFPRARFPNHAQCLTSLKGETHSVDSLHDTVAGEEMHVQVIDFKQRGHDYSFILTSRASRSPSPSSTKASTVVIIAIPGYSMSQGAVNK
jgi:hypothetical protein